MTGINIEITTPEIKPEELEEIKPEEIKPEELEELVEELVGEIKSEELVEEIAEEIKPEINEDEKWKREQTALMIAQTDLLTTMQQSLSEIMLVMMELLTQVQQSPPKSAEDTQVTANATDALPENPVEMLPPEIQPEIPEEKPHRQRHWI